MNKETKHIVLASGLHCIHIGNTVNVYTEKEYQQLTWWKYIKMKYFKSDD